MSSPRWQTLRKYSLRGILGLFALAVILYLVLCTLPSIFGHPRWFRRMLEDSLGSSGISCSIPSIHGNILWGLELADARLRMPLAEGTLALDAPTGTLAFQPAALLRGKFVIRKVAFSGAALRLETEDTPAPHDINPFDADAPLSLDNLSCDATLTPQNTLLADLQGDLCGIRLNIQANLQDLDQAFSCQEEEPPPLAPEETANSSVLATTASQAEEEAPDSPAVDVVSEDATPDEDDAPAVVEVVSPLAETRQSLHAALERARKELRLLTSKAGEVTLRLTLAGSLKSPDALSLQGDLGIADALIRDREVSRAYGKFHLQKRILTVDDLHIVYDTEESLFCQLLVDLHEGTIQGQASARLHAKTLLRYLALPEDTLPADLEFPKPLQLQATLPVTPWDFRSPEPTLDFQCEDLKARDLTIHALEGRLALHQNTLSLENLKIHLTKPSPTAEPLAGSFQLELPTKTLQGRLEGPINLPATARGLHLLHNNKTPLEAFSQARLKLLLNPSPLQDPKQWDGVLSLAQPQGSLGKFKLKDLSLLLKMLGGRLSLQGKAQVPGALPNQLSLQADTTLPTNSQDPLAIHATTTLANDDSQVLDAAVAVLLTDDASTLELADGHLSFRPELLYALLKEPLDLKKDMALAWFQCLDANQPARLDFHLPPLSFKAPKDGWEKEEHAWQARGTLHLPQMRLSDTDFTALDAQVTLQEDQILFSHLTGKLQNSPATLSGDLTIRFDPFQLTFNNLRIQGPPAHIKKLLHAPKVVRFFGKVWDNFQWSPESAADGCLLDISFLRYRQYSGNLWDFSLNGTVNARNFSYQGMPLGEFATTLRVRLPEEGVSFSNIHLANTADTPEDGIQGEGKLTFQRGVFGSFRLKKTAGAFPLLDTLAHAFPKLQKKLALFKLDPTANLQCLVRFHDDEFFSLSLDGTLETPLLQYRHAQLQNLQGKWRFDNNVMTWDFPTAHFFQGDLATTGVYDFSQNQGEVLAVAKNIPLVHIQDFAKGKLVDPPQTPEEQKYAEGKLPGKMNVEGHFRVLKDWAGLPIYLEGDGKLHLYDMDLWRIPTLTTLGRILSRGTFKLFSKDRIASLGKISTLDADFQCHDAAISFENIRTDGSFIALAGEGVFRLDNKQMDFQISSQLLKSVSFVSWILRPISWVFEAQLSGTPKDHHWEIRTPLRKLFQ